jgi:hypothetical protein
MFIARLPVGVPDEAERLKIIMQATAIGKSRADQGVAGIVALPASLAGRAWRGPSGRRPHTSTCT